ncbi:MAG TPA: hypothetical protein VJG90_02235 [Candidatus Nanoarchaeia archaeon]|nr:hypothetical protein [Candidatus Nanoarchaeia archaeon]
MTITLEDCLVRTRPTGWGDSRHIVFSLPGTIDLRGIKARIDNYQVGHERFSNRFGTLYVACDFCVRYSPKQESQIYFYGFKSLHAWPEFKGNEFMISGLNILESDDKLKIVAKIKRHKSLRPYLNSFFDWLNDSIRKYGEALYKPIKT